MTKELIYAGLFAANVAMAVGWAVAHEPWGAGITAFGAAFLFMIDLQTLIRRSGP